jgi:hypothetical protein
VLVVINNYSPSASLSRNLVIQERCVSVRSVSAKMCFSVQCECKDVFQCAVWVQRCVSVCNVSANMCFSVQCECKDVFQCAMWVQRCVSVCSVSAKMFQCAMWLQRCVFNVKCEFKDLFKFSVYNSCPAFVPHNFIIFRSALRPS